VYRPRAAGRDRRGRARPRRVARARPRLGGGGAAPHLSPRGGRGRGDAVPAAPAAQLRGVVDRARDLAPPRARTATSPDPGGRAGVQRQGGPVAGGAGPQAERDSAGAGTGTNGVVPHTPFALRIRSLRIS